jgi:hypothetical protein
MSWFMVKSAQKRNTQNKRSLRKIPHEQAATPPKTQLSRPGGTCNDSAKHQLILWKLYPKCIGMSKIH